MVVFDIKDLKKINPTSDLVEALSTHKGIIPMCLNLYVDWVKYNENLKSEGLYDKVYEEYYKIRVDYKKTNDKKKFKKTQLTKWLEKYPMFNKILSEAIKD